MFRLIEDFDKAWTYEAGATQKIMDALTDRSLSQAVSEGHRTLGRIAWHIITTMPEMMPATGLAFEGVSANAPMPGSAEEIRTAYASVAKQVLDQVKANWSDATLGVADEMYGEKWARGQTLKVLVDHQAHHRGQMTVLMRQAGLAVPGIYGPSKEEWSNYGAKPPEV